MRCCVYAILLSRFCLWSILQDVFSSWFMEPMQPLCKVQVHEGGEATGFEKLQVPEFVGFGLVDTRCLHNSQRISWNLNKSLDSLCSGGGEVVPKKHVSCCFQWKEFEFSLRISLVLSGFSKFLNFALETMYSTKQLELITPRGICVSFVEYLGDLATDRTTCEKKWTVAALKWTGILEVWDWTPMGFGWWYDVYIYNCIFVIQATRAAGLLCQTQVVVFFHVVIRDIGEKANLGFYGLTGWKRGFLNIKKYWPCRTMYHRSQIKLILASLLKGLMFLFSGSFMFQRLKPLNT